MLKSTQQELNVRKRDGRIVSFDAGLIIRAIQKAFCAEQEMRDTADLDDALLEEIHTITSEVVSTVEETAASDLGVSAEDIQDVVERTRIG